MRVQLAKVSAFKAVVSHHHGMCCHADCVVSSDLPLPAVTSCPQGMTFTAAAALLLFPFMQRSASPYDNYYKL
jgi:hypothetical protein